VRLKREGLVLPYCQCFSPHKVSSLSSQFHWPFAPLQFTFGSRNSGPLISQPLAHNGCDSGIPLSRVRQSWRLIVRVRVACASVRPLHLPFLSPYSSLMGSRATWNLHRRNEPLQIMAQSVSCRLRPTDQRHDAC